MMRADFDSQANAVAITLVAGKRADHGERVHERAIVAVAGDLAVDVELLYPDQGIDEPLAQVALRYDLDRQALLAAAKAALAAPDRPVLLDVGGPTPA
jgi:hypothetical protein